MTVEAREAYTETIFFYYWNFAFNKRWKHELSSARNSNDNPKAPHAYIRRKKKGKPAVVSLKVDKTMVPDTRKMTGVFDEYFGSIYSFSITLACSQPQRTVARMNPLCIILIMFI